MCTGSELIRATRPFAREDRGRSWWHLLTTLAVLAAFLGAACASLPWLLRLPCSALAGLVLVRLFVIYHDHQHGAILRDSRLAGGLMWAAGLLLLSPPSVWKRSHNHHHKHNARNPGSGIGVYPTMTTSAYAEAGWPERLRYRLARHPTTMLLGYATTFAYGMCLRPLLSDPRQHWDAAAALGAHAALMAGLALAAPPGVLLFGLLLPWGVCFALGSYLFYAQHNFPAVRLPARAHWNLASAALQSSSYMAMNPVLRWLTGNIGYHHVHHLNARIPFYRLPEAMAALPELQSPGTTSLAPLDVYRCLRLGLWDAEQECMVPFGGAFRGGRGGGVEENGGPSAGSSAGAVAF
jgi:omega-6 fatty acid desaturase (delta-12 desaturase)